MAPPYRADQVGSLIRPKYLLEARSSFVGWLESTEKDRKDEPSHEDYKETAKEAEQRAVKEVIAEQVDRGILPLSSGEFERPVFYGGFFEALDGMEMRHTRWDQFRPDFPTNKPLLSIPSMTGRRIGIATSKVRYSKSPYLEDWLYIRSLLPEEKWKDVKITLPAPCWWHIQLKEGEAWKEGVYNGDEQFLEDMSKCVRAEMMTLYDAGV